MARDARDFGERRFQIHVGQRDAAVDEIEATVGEGKLLAGRQDEFDAIG
jgi:hypothetical protein